MVSFDIWRFRLYLFEILVWVGKQITGRPRFRFSRKTYLLRPGMDTAVSPLPPHSMPTIQNARIHPHHTATLFDSAPSLLAVGENSPDTSDSGKSACPPGTRTIASPFLSARSPSRLRPDVSFFRQFELGNLKLLYVYRETLFLSNLAKLRET